MGTTYNNQSRSKCVNNKKLPKQLNDKTSEILLSLGIDTTAASSTKLIQIIEMLHIVLETSAIIAITDKAGDITYANEQFCQLVGLSKSEVSGKNLKECTANLYNEDFIEVQAVTHIETEIASEEIKVETKDGKVIYLNSMILPFYENGEDASHFLLFYHDITRWKQAETTMKDIYYLDPLTQLPNRQQFEKDLQKELEGSKKGKLCAVFFVDLDRFKFFNDTMGHTVGDDLIENIANNLRELQNEQLTLYRFGGDEFTFLMRSIEDRNDIHSQADNMLKIFKKPFNIEGNNIFLTASVGVSISSEQVMTIKKLIKQADNAMHFAKERGKDTYQVYEPHMSTAYAERLKVETHLRSAIEKNEFCINYQPQIDLNTKKIIGVEALIRWTNPELGFVPPNNFIPLAEESGLIDQIGEWVLNTACRQVKRWQVEFGLFIRVGINISPKQFQRPDFVSKIDRVIKETGINPKYIDLEITENGLMQNTSECILVLKRLKEIGVKISIDDFGTGYSSLSYLKRFPIDTLKIDQSFVRELTDNTNDQAIVTSIINLAHNMQLNVIAEGVETVEIVKFLNTHHCDEMQGYLYSKPLSVDSFEKFITNLAEHEKVLKYNDM